MLTITWSLANGCGQQQINETNKKYTSNAGDFDGHAAGAIQAAMVNKFVETIQNTNKAQL
jgi:hypothetical protein